MQNKRNRRVLWAGIAVLTYALIGFFVVPWILGKVIPKKAGEFLNREVSIERIRVNPFALSGSFEGLLIKDLDGAPLISWDEVYGNFELSSVFHWAFTFKEIRIVSPYVNVYIQPDNTLNISDILERLDQETAGATSSEPSQPPALRIEQVTLTNAVAELSDLTLREPFTRRVGPVDLVLEHLHTDPDTANPYSVSGSTSTGERFGWSGLFYLFPIRSEGTFRVENVNIAHYAPLYRDFLSLTIHGGVVDLSVDYTLQHGGAHNVLTVSNTMFHLASMQVSADGEGAQNAIEIDDLKVSGVEADLWNRSARVGNVAVHGGSLFVHRTPTADINLMEMAKPSNPDAEPAGTILYAMQAVTNLVATFLTTTNHVTAVVDALDVKDWRLRVLDEVNTRPVELHLDNITVSGRNLSNIPGDGLSMDVGCRWNTNGTVNVGIQAALFPVQATIRVAVDRIELPPLDPYVEPFASVLLLDSKLSVDGVVHVQQHAADAPLDIGYEGRVALEDFSSVDGVMGTDLLEWQAVNIDGIHANLHPLEIRVDQVGIHHANARIIVETNRSINVLNAMQVDDASAPAPVVEDSGPVEAAGDWLADLGLPDLTVSSVLISNASLEVMDRSTQPHLNWNVTEVNGMVGGLSSTSTQRAELRLTAMAGGTAPVNITGRLNPLNPTVDTDITVQLTGMDLVPFSPYSGRYAGYQLRKGALSLDLDYHVRGRKLDSENLIVMNQFAFGQAVNSPEATKLPVKMGVAVLKDRNGVIELNVPIEGNLDDPEFRLGRVIGRTIMITLTKMLSSPFSLLGGLVGGNAEEMSEFSFAPGSSRITPGITNGLHKLSQALYERPALEVEIIGSVDAERDGLSLRQQKLTRQLQQLRWNDLLESAQANTKPDDIILSPDLRISMLRKYFVQLFPDEARSSKAPPGLEETFYAQMTDKILDQIDVSEQDFRLLASARSEAIKAWLVKPGNVDPARLFLTENDPTTRDGSHVQLQLQ